MEEFKDDLLRQYITSERIEKAPEGFTSKVMTRIQVDTSPLMVAEKSRKKKSGSFYFVCRYNTVDCFSRSDSGQSIRFIGQSGF
jgi:hypothetical protein